MLLKKLIASSAFALFVSLGGQVAVSPAHATLTEEQKEPDAKGYLTVKVTWVPGNGGTSYYAVTVYNSHSSRAIRYKVLVAGQVYQGAVEARQHTLVNNIYTLSQPSVELMRGDYQD
jgi:hypothetical protein